jgi:hypothetical protein
MYIYIYIYMPPSLKGGKLYILSTECMWAHEFYMVNSVNTVNRFVFVMEMRWVFCSTGTEFINIIYMNFRLQMD